MASTAHYGDNYVAEENELPVDDCNPCSSCYKARERWTFWAMYVIIVT